MKEFSYRIQFILNYKKREGCYNEKNLLIGIIFLSLIALCACFVSSVMFFPSYAADALEGTNMNITIKGASNNTFLTFDNGTNLSGIIDLNITFNVNATHNQHIINITFQFNRTEALTGYNLSLTNTTRNQSMNDSNNRWQNTAFDTSLIPDGRYNITVTAVNASIGDGGLYQNASGGQDVYIISNITVDNTPPKVGNFTLNSSFHGGTSTLLNFSGTQQNISFNVSAADNSTNVSRLILEFSNATSSSSGSRFNLTAGNVSGHNWTVPYNLSTLRGGFHTVKVIAIDYAGSVNQSVTMNFTVNIPPNVTLINVTQGFNFSTADSMGANRTFNLSVTNMTGGAGSSNVTSITLTFNNATGSDFNITILGSSRNGSGNLTRTDHGHFWTLSYNISLLTEGWHEVTIFANDTRANYNKTTNFTFLIDNTAPVVNNFTLRSNGSGQNYTILTMNVTLNVTIFENASNVSNVTFEFNNATYGSFNLTTTFNGSGGGNNYTNFTRQINISLLRGGDSVSL